MNNAISSNNNFEERKWRRRTSKRTNNFFAVWFDVFFVCSYELFKTQSIDTFKVANVIIITLAPKKNMEKTHRLILILILFQEKFSLYAAATRDTCVTFEWLCANEASSSGSIIIITNIQYGGVGCVISMCYTEMDAFNDVSPIETIKSVKCHLCCSVNRLELMNRFQLGVRKKKWNAQEFILIFFFILKSWE